MTKDIKIKYCPKCSTKTLHIISGFGTPGSLVGNARWRCTKCKQEDLRKGRQIFRK